MIFFWFVFVPACIPLSRMICQTTAKKKRKKILEFALGLFHVEGESTIERLFTQVIVDPIFVTLSNATSVAPELAENHKCELAAILLP